MVEALVIGKKDNWRWYKKITNLNVTIVGHAEDLTTCIHYTHATDICFAFFDIDNIDNFEIHQILLFLQSKKIGSVIFSESQIHAFEIVKYNIYDYILKPFNDDHVAKILERLARDYSNEIHVNEAIKRKIAIPSNTGVHYFEYDNIIRCVAENNYTHIYTSTCSLLVAKTLKKMESLLPYPLYIRTHKSYIVNLNHIIKYNKSKGGFLVLSDEFEVPIAQRRKEKVLYLVDSFAADY